MTLYIQRHHACDSPPDHSRASMKFPHPEPKPQQPPVVLLHGWGMSSAAMQPLLASLQSLREVWCVDLPGFGGSAGPGAFSEAGVLARLAESLPERALLVGWSLGGMLAMAYAAAYPERVEGLVTLAANACFVARGDWPSAMAPVVNAQFNEAFERDPEASVQRFCGLVAEGSPQRRERLRQLRAQADAPRATCWRQALDYLATADHRAALRDLSLPALHLYGAGDALVPAGCAGAVAALNPAHEVRVIAEAGHALHWDAPEAVAAAIEAFIRPLPARQAQRRKQQVARSFSRAAPGYEAAARLQREVGAGLLARLSGEAGTVLDLGSGTGYFSADLKRRTGARQLVAVDIAEGMLHYAREHHSGGVDAWIGGDAEALPLREQSVDLIFSSLAIQWCEDIDRLFAELSRVLKPGGRLHLATLGPDTLAELKQAWRQVDARVHVNRFVAPAVLQAAMAARGFGDIACSEYTRTLYSDSVRELSGELKELGAHNVNSGRPRGLTGRRQLAALEQAYERFRTPQGLPASYQVVYLSARREDLE